MNRPSLSIVVPCYNEAACLDILHARISGAAKVAVGDDYEIVLINDGSRDDSWPVMQRLAAADPPTRRDQPLAQPRPPVGAHRRSRSLRGRADPDHRRRSPGSARTPVRHARGDGGKSGRRRLRGPPPARGRDGVQEGDRCRVLPPADPDDRNADPARHRRFPPDERRALDAFLSLPEQARFIRGMVAWIGFKQVPFPYDRAERLAGETNYPLAKMIRLAFDAVTGFSTAPLRFASHAGLALTGVSLLLFVYIAIGWLSGSAVRGWTSTMLVTVFLGAVQMFVLGMIGEYLGGCTSSRSGGRCISSRMWRGRSKGRRPWGSARSRSTPPSPTISSLLLPRPKVRIKSHQETLRQAAMRGIHRHTRAKPVGALGYTDDSDGLNEPEDEHDTGGACRTAGNTPALAGVVIGGASQPPLSVCAARRRSPCARGLSFDFAQDERDIEARARA